MSLTHTAVCKVQNKLTNHQVFLSRYDKLIVWYTKTSRSAGAGVAFEGRKGLIGFLLLYS